MNNAVYRIGTILYALVIACFGAGHLMKAEVMKGMVPSYLPSPIVWVYLTGTAMILAAVAIIIDRQSRLAGYLLFLLLAIIIGTMHVPAFMHAADDAAKMLPQTMILKDTAMAAAALMIASRGK